MTREEFARQTRERAYAERIGKVYGDFEVVSIRWDEEKKKQEWELRCTHCGITRKTTAWGNYTNGKVGHCKNCSSKTKAKIIGTTINGWEITRAVCTEKVGESYKYDVEMVCGKCGYTRFTEHRFLLSKCPKCENN